MDNKLIWLIKSAAVTPTRKRLEQLRESNDLYDESSINVKDPLVQRQIEAYERACAFGCETVTYDEADYPQSLRDISLPPRVLFVRGDRAALGGLYAGIVGSRETDDYGIRTAQRLAFEAGQIGAGIVSGGAVGIDAAAHTGALRAGARTIAVLGCGIDVPYPKANTALFDRISESGGAVITEFLPQTPPEGSNFPHRNRIIAALSCTVAVVRAGVRSGALITAAQAEKTGKSVFAVPGNIDDKLSAGTNALIRDGAMVITSPIDFIDEIVLKSPQIFSVTEEKPLKKKSGNTPPKPLKKPVEGKDINNLTENEKAIAAAIGGGASMEEIEKHTCLSPSILTATVSMMELKGVIKKGMDRKYKLLIGGEN